VGHAALICNTTASDNTAVGREAMYSNTEGHSNTAVGHDALYDNSTGTLNTAVGMDAGENINSGSENTAIGVTSLQGVTTGSQNVAVGRDAGKTLQTGSGNVYLGYNNASNGTNKTNEIVIGCAVTSVGSNYFTFGKGSGNDRVYNLFTSNASFTRASDLRLKTDIQTDNLGLDFINNLRPVTYKWKPSNEVDQSLTGYYNATNQVDTDVVMHGFLAQEVKQALIDSGVSESDVSKYGVWSEEPTGVQAISREMFIMPLVKAIQELKAEIDELKKGA